MPEYIISVAGKDIRFLVDSGATESLIRSQEFQTTPKMSARGLRTVGVSGKPLVERFTAPLTCSEETEKHFKQYFLLSDHCPVNLLARDLMCLLGIILIFTPRGLWWPEFLTWHHSLLNRVKGSCCMSIREAAVNSVNHSLIAEVKTLFHNTDTQTDFMSPQEPGCRSHLHLGADTSFEKEWFRKHRDKNSLRLNWLYWSNNRCAVSVVVNNPHCKTLFQIPN